MAHPPLWPSICFYPVGNTSPVCLTSHLPIAEHATVLLLGAGDLRNILYSTYVDGATRTLDFTACDYEPAIFARNVLLLTLLFDGEVSATSLWDFYYHFLIDDATLSMITSQCSKLLDLSKELETWHSCRYGNFIRFCSRYTLAETRRIWSLYEETDKWPNSKRKSFKKRFLAGMREVADREEGSASSARSAGPLAVEACHVAVSAHLDFWKTGVTTVSAARTATSVNPTFAFAIRGEGCVSHNGLCPLAAFHLAPAFIRASGRTLPPTVSDAYVVAQSQFRSWCDAFMTSIKEHRVTLRLVLGDALAVCHTISHIATSGDLTAHHPVMQWQTSPLIFDGGDYTASCRTAPVSFDVINSSNLADHLGYLNVVIATTFLLRPSPFSVLQTETLLPFGKDPTTSFVERMCGDIRTMALLLDLVPVSFLSGFSTQSNSHELLSHNPLDKPGQHQYHERIIWKKPSLAGSLDGTRAGLSLDAEEVTSLLLATYRKMFAHENPTMTTLAIHPGILRDLSTVHYSRLSFAHFMGCVKRNVACNWEAVNRLVMPLIRMDTQILHGGPYYRDLVCQLHLMGLCIDDDQGSLFSWTRHNELGIFRTWPSKPPLVGIVFTVPRQKYKALYDKDIAQLGTPILKADLINYAGPFPSLHSFCSLRLVFGSVVSRGTGRDLRVTVTEDPLGQRGSSDIVVVFVAPSELIAVLPEHSRVSLGIQSTFVHSGPYRKKFGPLLEIYSVKLTDTKSVHIVDVLHGDHQAPFNIASTPSVFASASKRGAPSMSIRAGLNETKDSIISLVNQEELSKETKLELAKQGNKVAYKQTHPCLIQVSIGDHIIHNCHYPYPVLEAEARLRIARTSGWVEVKAPLASFKLLATNRFPFGRIAGIVAPWNMHRVVLERLPVVAASTDLRWLGCHLSLMLSDTERKALEHRRPSPSALTQVKQSIATILQGVAGAGSQQDGISVWGLHKTSGGGVGTVIFVTDVRLDLSAHTVVADGHVLPLDDQNTGILLSHLSTGLKNIVPILCSDDEITEWARLIPAFVERCRDWTHKKDCAYLKKGVVPLSDQFGQTPVCDCGKGKVSQAFRARKEWAVFIPYVTRIAISPIFAVPYLQPVGQELGKMFRNLTKTQSHAPALHPQCLHCGRSIPNDAPIMRCSRCKQAIYCNGTCQKSDWKKHKITCTTG